MSVVPFQRGKIRQTKTNKTVPCWKNYEKLKKLAEETSQKLEPWQKEEVENLLQTNIKAFSDDDGTLGCTRLV